MTFSKEEISKAFNEVLSERVPAFSDIPDHVFSEHFEQRMNKLIEREAAHPWDVSHTTTRNLLIAALIAVLLMILSLSVSGIRDPIFNFFTRHFDTYDDVVFDDTEKTEIEHVYEITALPEGFELNQRMQYSTYVISIYEDKSTQNMSLRQKVPSPNREGIVDNEKTNMDSLEIDNKIVFSLVDKTGIIFAWEIDGYEFWLDIKIMDFTLENAIQIYRSIK